MVVLGARGQAEPVASDDQWNGAEIGEPQGEWVVQLGINGGIRDAGEGIPLSEFERAGASDANAARTAKNSRNIDKNTDQTSANTTRTVEHDDRIEELEKATSRQDKGIALLAALDFQRPQAGKTFRVAMGGGTYEDEVALGGSISMVKGAFDFSVGLANSNDETLAKGNVGFSF